MKRLTMGCGFITNSSSVIHYFDKVLLTDPDVAAFVAAYDLQDGLLGSEIYSRSHCSSFLVHEEMKIEARNKFRGQMESYELDTTDAPSFAVDEKDVMVIVYGDEYTSFASTLCQLLVTAAERLGKGDRGTGEFH
jgi:hypothetical protein